MIKTLKQLSSNIFLLFFLSILFSLFIAYLFYRRHSQSQNNLFLNSQDLDEKRNSLLDEIRHLEIMSRALNQKILRYQSLENIVEELNKGLGLEYVANKLLDITFGVIAQNKGTALLYLVNPQLHKLYLFSSRKEDEDLVIKAKEGDVFDQWVLKHTSPLLIEDIRKDFRFDLEKLKSEHLRPLASLISVALVNQDKFIGILRLDNPKPNAYGQDDLRFLNTISDLGAIALGNAQLFQKTLELAIKDGLTSLYTRRYFQERLNEELKRSQREGSEFSVFIIDIDYFKKCNDEFGHVAGDIVLKRISEVMSAFFEKHAAIISRFGGEEFAVILPKFNKSGALLIADELCGIVRNTKINLRRKDINVTVSMGVSSFPQQGNDEEELLRSADSALYMAKQSGRDKACCL